MSLSDLSEKAAVMAAMKEFDDMGRDQFLNRYGYGAAKNHFIIHEGRAYDSKAIAGVAVGKQHPDLGPMKSTDFTGGELSVVRKLRNLGFDIQAKHPDAQPGAFTQSSFQIIRRVFGDPVATTAKLAVWRSQSGLELALQLEQRQSRLWVEICPPSGQRGISVKEYRPKETRTSNLKANAPRLAQPFPAFLVTAADDEALASLLDWYASKSMPTVVTAELERMKSTFLARMSDFQSFAHPGAKYLEEERSYKDELISNFISEVMPLLDNNADDPMRLTAAYYGILTKKLQSTGHPQNIVGWQAVDWLKPIDRERATLIGQSLSRLLASKGSELERLSIFVGEIGDLLKENGASGPYGLARLIGSCALMLKDPGSFVAIRTDIFENAVTLLLHRMFPPHTDESGRAELSLYVTRLVMEHMASEWRWSPRDYVDVQSFLWVAMRNAEAIMPEKNTSAEADAVGGGRRYWVEKTIVANRPDRLDGQHALGRALWSPQRAKNGGDIYANMRRVREGDVILHLTDNRVFSGVSIAEAGVDESFRGLPGTDWEGPAYRVQLSDFESLDPPLPRKAFLETEPFATELRELVGTGAKGLFYNSKLELNQGAYLTEATPTLLSILCRAYEAFSGKMLPHSSYSGSSEAEDGSDPIYTMEDALADLFLEREEVTEILALWKAKKNISLQGPPGVGKSFAAEKLARLLLGTRDHERVQLVQFHQSYSYEDFVEGYRPTATGFELRPGKFVEFCRRAEADPERTYVFIIDEINRGNLSKILGELMLLIEGDKRERKWGIQLASGKVSFYVPPNVYLLGLMNTADRSLSVVDYALRRRFAFYDLNPKLNSTKFKALLSQSGIEEALIEALITRVGKLNDEIVSDVANLGPGFAIGHSFFCTSLVQGEDGVDWYSRIIRTEIVPLLREYWFDAPEKAKTWGEQLLTSL